MTDTVHDLQLTPPQDITAERATLGGMLLSRNAIDECLELVTGPEFYQPGHEHIFNAIARLHMSGQPADAVTVSDQLTTTGDLLRAGGQAYLHQLAAAVPVAASAGYYAQIVSEKAAQRRLVEAGTRITALGYAATGGELDDLYRRATEALETVTRALPGRDAAASLWAPHDLGTVLDFGEQLMQPTVLARTDGQCLLYPAAVHSVSGEPESGKSWLALIAAAQILRDPDGRHVTYIDFEDRAGRVVPRLLHLGAPRDAILQRFHYIRPTDPLGPADRKHLDRAAEQSALAVLDGVTEAMTMHGLSLLDNEDAAKYLDLLPRPLAEAGPAVLQIDHVVKDAENRGRYAVGAQHKLAGLDGAAYGVKVLYPFGRGKLGRAQVVVNKDRPGAIREAALGQTIAQLVIDSRGEAMRAVLELPTAMPTAPDGHQRPTNLMEKISRRIEVFPGSSRKQVEDAVPGRANGKRRAIDALLAEGFLEVEGGPRGAHLLKSVRVYREADDDAS